MAGGEFLTCLDRIGLIAVKSMKFCLKSSIFAKLKQREFAIN
jgi:hypothetical protein